MGRDLLVCALLLCIAGCGCTPGEVPTPPDAQQAILDIKLLLPGIPVDPPKAFKVDVAFVLDDSDTMLAGLLSCGGLNLDRRERSQAAQAIMRRLVSTIQGRLAAAYGGQAPAIDFAFAVARYEDFGGGFTSVERRSGSVDDPSNRENDMDARPFILNMPMLRQAHPDFGARFAQAIRREAPGDGNPYVLLPGYSDPLRVIDPQSGIEALYQVAAPDRGDGLFGGFDGNDNGSTLDSGAPTSENGVRNPQTRPGPSGDVPAIRYVPAGTDADGQPIYAVADELGEIVMLPREGGGAPVPSVSSGNSGGVGWRPDAARFVILATDIATVAPVEFVPPLPTVTSTDGGSTAPRVPQSVLIAAFDPGLRESFPGVDVSEPRFGEAGPGGTVAPAGAHTVQQAFDRLNALDIEVILLGAEAGGIFGGTGPNNETPVGSSPPTQAGEHDPGNPLDVRPEFDPWFWLNATSRLTTPTISTMREPDDADGFPGVYELRTLWPLDTDDPEGVDESTILDTVTDALVERIQAWIDPPGTTLDPDSPYLAESGPIVPFALRPELPTATYRCELRFNSPSAASGVIQIAPSAASTLVEFASAAVPTYWTDGTPSNAPISMFKGVQDVVDIDRLFLTYRERDRSVTLPAHDVIEYSIEAAFTGSFVYPSGPALDPSLEDDLLARIRDGVAGDGSRSMTPLPPLTTATTTFPVTTRARMEVWVRDTRFPDFGVELLSVDGGIAIVSDQTFDLGVPPPDQVRTAP